jgi:small subunit ribosomal protein S6
MRPYELMVILDGELDDAAVQEQVQRIAGHVDSRGGRVATTDVWGKRRFAYEIDHRTEGHYVVYEMLAEGSVIDDLERVLRLADEVVRHKVIRLPDKEAAKRGLLAEAAGAPAAAGSSGAERRGAGAAGSGQ